METDSARHALIIDDDPALRLVLSRALERDGFEIWTCADGAEALDMLAIWPTPDLILLDLNMPVMDGWRFRVEQRRDRRLAAIPTLLLSGEVNLKEHAALMGVSGFVSKPVDLADLQAAVRDALAGARIAG